VAEDVFGAHATHSYPRLDMAGLLIGDGGVVALSATHATIRSPGGAELTYMRRPRPGAVAIWKLVGGRPA
jgi:hypothetical protein